MLTRFLTRYKVHPAARGEERRWYQVFLYGRMGGLRQSKREFVAKRWTGR